MRSLWVAGILLLFGPMAWAGADELPVRKPGLWQISYMRLFGDQATLIRECVSAESEAARARYERSLYQGCAEYNVRRNDNVVVVDSKCLFLGSQLREHTMMIVVSDNLYAIDRRIHFDPPMLDKPDAVETQDAKWMSACPSDLKPGDVQTSEGVRYNVIEDAKSLGRP